MKKIKNKLSVLLLLIFVSTMFLACEKEPDQYEVRLRNNAYSDALGLVPVKFDITKFTMGDITVENVKYGDFSEYFTVESGIEYNMHIEYDQYLWNAETNSWQFDNSFTDTMGPEEWHRDECNPQRITITIKSLLSMPVGANYTVYCDE